MLDVFIVIPKGRSVLFHTQWVAQQLVGWDVVLSFIAIDACSWWYNSSGTSSRALGKNDTLLLANSSCLTIQTVLVIFISVSIRVSIEKPTSHDFCEYIFRLCLKARQGREMFLHSFNGLSHAAKEYFMSLPYIN